jgi:hypothetical protein
LKSLSTRPTANTPPARWTGWSGTTGSGDTEGVGVTGKGVTVAAGGKVRVGRGVRLGAGVETVGVELASSVVVGVVVWLAVVGAVEGGGVRSGEVVRPGRLVGVEPGRVGVDWSEQAASSVRTKSREQIKKRICLDILLDSQLY